jgi:hypothetical protein
LAAHLAEENVGATDPYAIGAHGDLTATLTTLIHELGARAGIPATEIDATMKAIDNVDTSGTGKHGVPEEALRGAGVRDARKVSSLLTGFSQAVSTRSVDMKQRDEAALDEIQENKEARKRAMTGPSTESDLSEIV